MVAATPHTPTTRTLGFRCSYGGVLTSFRTAFILLFVFIGWANGHHRIFVGYWASRASQTRAEYSSLAFEKPRTCSEYSSKRRKNRDSQTTTDYSLLGERRLPITFRLSVEWTKGDICIAVFVYIRMYTRIRPGCVLHVSYYKVLIVSCLTPTW